MLTLAAIEIPSLSRCTATRHARQASGSERADAAACRRSEREAKDDGHGPRAVRGYDDGRSVGLMGRASKRLGCPGSGRDAGCCDRSGRTMAGGDDNCARYDWPISGSLRGWSRGGPGAVE